MACRAHGFAVRGPPAARSEGMTDVLRAIDKWLPGYLASWWRRPRGVRGPRHLIFCFADHFEPFRRDPGEPAPTPAQARESVREWVRAYRESVEGLADSDGRAPKHTFFYPAEEYEEGCVDELAVLCREGLAEVEIHLHHRNDTADGLREKLEAFRDVLRRRHGLLGLDASGAVRYGFVHGNWALCNSRPDGDWCGVNEEIGVLAATGCYADFTFPSAPSPTQPRMVNAIYRACDRPGKPRACDRGLRVRAVGGGASSARRAIKPFRAASSLMVIQGPLALDWSRRKWGFLPGLENGEVTAAHPPLSERLVLWARQGIHVEERPDWVFVKVHTHGFVPVNRRVILGGPMREAHRRLVQTFGHGKPWFLHYVSAREMYNLVRAAEDGRDSDPRGLADYEVGSPNP